MTAARRALVRRGQHLQYFTIAYNLCEGLIAIAAGAAAGSVALIGFGVDSAIEVAAGLAALWRLHADLDERRRERVEAVTLRIVGATLLALALYVAVDAIRTLLGADTAGESPVGIALALLSLVVMPLVTRAKRTVARGMRSDAMAADARQTEFCTYLSAILLAGLALNALLGWSWADPLAACVMVPIIAKEGVDALRGKACADDACGCA